MISLENISKSFNQNKNEIQVLDGIQLDIKNGEFVTIFGPNGSGKSTLLNIISGLDKAGTGNVLVNNKRPEEAKVGFVFQNYNESLFPWRTAQENVEFALEVQNVPKPEQKKISEHLLKKVGLYNHKDKYLYELSGGQKQLVAICRAFAYNPDVLLMDEPFSALDYSTTKKMEMELMDIWQEKKITTLFISHDIDEAIFLADRVVVLSPRPGKIKQIFEVNLPRPRNLEMLASKEFFDLRNKILEAFIYE